MTAPIRPLSPTEQYLARRLRKKLAAGIHFLTEAKDLAALPSPAVLSQLGTQEALITVAKRLGEVRDIAKGERPPKQEVPNGS